MSGNPHTWYHWAGRDSDRMARECGRFTDLVCTAAGKRGESPNQPQGQDVEISRMSLGISKVEWVHFVPSAAEALEQSELTDDEADELFSLLAKAKASITDDGQAGSPVRVFAVFPHQLTRRETEVLRLVALGMNNPEIAGELFISINTVTRHISNIFAKTSTTNRVQAAVYAARRHLV